MVGTNATKVDDTNSVFRFIAYYNGAPIAFKAEDQISFKIGQANRVIKEAPGYPDKDVTQLNVADLKGLGPGTYQLEMWVTRHGKTDIWPTDGFYEITLKPSLMNSDISDGVTSVTLADFERKFSDLSAKYQTNFYELKDELTKHVETLKGPKGDKGDPGDNPVINAEGVWQVGATSTGIKAQGPQGPQGERGPAGAPFKIVKTFPSVEALDGTGLTEGNMVVISNEESDPTNGRLYVWEGNKFTYLVDLSGMQGIQGPRGPRGAQGDRGLEGKSNYQLWLDAGHTGSVNDYLETLGMKPDVLNDYLTKQEAGSTYVTQKSANDTYVKQSSMSDYATNASVDTKVNAAKPDLSGYLKTTTAENEFAKSASLNDAIFNALKPYLMTADANKSFASKSSLADYLTKALAESTYAKEAEVSGYGKRLTDLENKKSTANVQGFIDYAGTVDSSDKIKKPGDYKEGLTVELVKLNSVYHLPVLGSAVQFTFKSKEQTGGSSTTQILISIAPDETGSGIFTRSEYYGSWKDWKSYRERLKTLNKVARVGSLEIDLDTYQNPDDYFMPNGEITNLPENFDNSQGAFLTVSATTEATFIDSTFHAKQTLTSAANGNMYMRISNDYTHWGRWTKIGGSDN